MGDHASLGVELRRQQLKFFIDLCFQLGAEIEFN
jgi:hypothetical protein